MRSQKLLVKALVFTVACLFISYASGKFAGRGQDEKYPLSVLSAVADRAGTATVAVNLSKTIPILKSKRVVLKTTSVDVEVEFSSKEAATFLLKAALPIEKDKPDSAWSFKESGDESIIEVNEASHDFEKGFDFNFQRKDGKLKVTLPLSVVSLKIETVSGQSKVIGKALDLLDVKSVSGDFEGKFEHLDNFKRKAVSGETKLIANLDHAAGKSVSGDFSIESKNESPKIEVSTTSGEVKVFFDKKPSVALQFASVSGESHIDAKFGTLTSGVGSLIIKSVSGDVSIGSK